MFQFQFQFLFSTLFLFLFLILFLFRFWKTGTGTRAGTGTGAGAGAGAGGQCIHMSPCHRRQADLWLWHRLSLRSGAGCGALAGALDLIVLLLRRPTPLCMGADLPTGDR